MAESIPGQITKLHTLSRQQLLEMWQKLYQRNRERSGKEQGMRFPVSFQITQGASQSLTLPLQFGAMSPPINDHTKT